MTHPLTPHVLELAAPIAASLGLDVVNAVFQTNHSPPVLRVDIRNLAQDTSLDDCERMSRALEEALEESTLIPDAYVLEVSSPGISRYLTMERDFISFKGFSVTVSLNEPFHGQKVISGKLIQRDETHLHLNLKGRAIAIPRDQIISVQFDE